MNLALKTGFYTASKRLEPETHGFFYRLRHSKRHLDERNAYRDLARLREDDDVLQKTAEWAVKAGWFTSISVYRLDKGVSLEETAKMKDTLTCVASAGIGKEQMLKTPAFERNNQQALWLAMNKREPYVVNDTAREMHRVAGETHEVKNQRAFVDIPINGKYVISADKSGRRVSWRITQRDVDKLLSFVEIAGGFIEQREKTRQIAEQNEIIKNITEGNKHDANGDITVIKTAAQRVMKLHPEIPKKYLDMIVRGANSLAELLDYNFTQMHAGKNATFDFSELARQIGEKPEERGMVFVDPQSLVIDSNEKFLSRIVTNLVSNGLKYNDREEKEKVVHVRGKIIQRSLVVEVADNGNGIPQDKWVRVFERKARADDTGKPGTGLGLWIAKELVEKMGGTIEVAWSEKGNGTLFRFSIPLTN